MLVFVDLLDSHGVDAVLVEHFRGALCGVDLEAEVGVLFGDLADLRLVGIADGDEHAAVLLHLVARRDKTLVQSLLERARYAEHLARGLHFGSEVVVDVDKLFKAEHGDLDGYVSALSVKSRAVAHVLKALAEHCAGGKVDHGNARYL